MSGSTPTSLPAGTDESWRRLDELVEQLTRLAKTDVAPHEFRAELLERVLLTIEAPGGAVWTTAGEGGEFRLEHAVGDVARRLREDAGFAGDQAEVVREVVEGGEPAIRPAPDRAPSPDGGRRWLLSAPLRIEGRVAGVVSVLQNDDVDADERRTRLDLLVALCDLADEYDRNRRLRSLEREVERHGRLQAFAERVHADLDLRRTAATIANECRRLVECDRVSVIVRRGGRCRVVSVSGVDDVDARSNVVRGLERLSAVVLRAEHAFWYGGEADAIAPQIEQPLRDYLEAAHAGLLAVLPLASEPKEDEDPVPAVGALVVERFDLVDEDALRAETERLLPHCASALRNAIDANRFPGAALARRWAKADWWERARSRPVWAGAAVAIVGVTALCVVPAEFEIAARGVLRPVERRHMFAPADGVVDTLRTEHDADVASGEILIRLRNEVLDLEFERIRGEMQTAGKRLDAVRAARTDARVRDERDMQRLRELSAEEEELKQTLQSLERQRRICREQLQALEIASPIDGRVVTWDVSRLLESRPVQRGQRLLTVVDVDGPWELGLEIDDDRAGHVRAAQIGAEEPLRVSFLLATDPGTTYEDRIERIAGSSEPNDRGEPVVRATVVIPAGTIRQPKPGAAVEARIHCGRRAVGYVWFHDLIDAARRRLFF